MNDTNDRIKSIYPNYQDEKSTGFVLLHTYAWFINSGLVEVKWFKNHFLLALNIPLLILVVAYVWPLSLIRTVIGPAIFLAVPCFIGFVVVGFLLLLLWAWFWVPAQGIAIYIGAIAVLVPRILMFTGTWHEPKRLLLRAATDGLFVCGFLFIGIFLVSGFHRLAMDAVWNSRHQKEPVPWLLWALFEALEGIKMLPEDPFWLHWVVVRDDLLGHLETAARCLEFIQQRFASRDSALDVEGGQYYLRRAAGVRRIKTRVCLPNSETPQYLEQELRQLLDLASKGDWDALPVADLPTETILPWSQRALKLGRSLVIAILPALGIFVLDAYNRLPAQLATYITPIAWTWTIIGVLSALDPRFGEKLSAFKDLPSFFDLKSKGDKH